MKLHPVIDYTVFFGRELSASPFSKLYEYPTDVIIVVLAKINMLKFAHGSHDVKADDRIFERCFSLLRMDWRQKVDFLRRNDESNDQPVFFTSQSVLFLMAKALANYRPIAENEFGNFNQMENDIFESLLAANQIYYKRLEVERGVTNLPAIWKLEMAQQTYIRSFTDIFGILPFKYLLFFRFIEERYGRQYTQEFAASFGLQSPVSFLLNFLNTITNATKDFEKTGEPKWFITMSEKQKKFMTPFILEANQLGKKPFKDNAHSLAQRPFYAFSRGIAVLDFHFFNHLIDIGLIFHFYHQTSLKELPRFSQYRQYQAELGKFFYEEYIAVQLLKKLFTHKNDQIFTDSDNPNFPDILLIQNDRDIFLFEVKSTRIHVDELETVSIPGLEKFLDENFAQQKTSTGEKPKGIYQLIKQLDQIKSLWGGRAIYPVIIYTEPVLDISGINYYLGQKMEEGVHSLRPHYRKIHPLTCINLDFFIQYYPHLKFDRFFLKACIKQYQKRILSNRKSYNKSSNPFTYLKANFSFARVMEIVCPEEKKPSYFREVVKDFGFEDHAEL